MKYEKSCGTIIFNQDNLVLLIADLDGNWGFPKGHVKEGESEEETALRETKEETNLDVITRVSHFINKKSLIFY